METRLQALEAKVSEFGNFRMDLGALISELALLNSNVKALTESMASSLKHSQIILQHVSQMHADKTTAAYTSIGNTTLADPPAINEPDSAERTRCYTRLHLGSRGKEVAKLPTPPPSEIVEAAVEDEGAEGSASPGSDCALISPPPKAIKHASTPRKRATANARGKALAKEREAGDGNEELLGYGTTLTSPPTKKVS